MLGKTNITVLQEGGIVTDIEDYSWINVPSGVRSDFIKTIFEGGYLVGVTRDGYVVYTMDGEVWSHYKLEYQDCRINDIGWDGENFILVGSYTEESKMTGLVFYTKDFAVWTQLEYSKSSGEKYTEYFSVYYQNGKYYITARDEDGNSQTFSVYLLQTNFEGDTEKVTTIKQYNYGYKHKESLTAKNGNSELLYDRTQSKGAAYDDHDIVKINNGEIKNIIHENNNGLGNKYAVFECKGILYLQKLTQENNYDLCKISDTGEVMIMCTGINFGFISGVYFNECQVFINRHEMLVVRKKESFLEKTLDDLLEIVPEMNMNCITKAFGCLFIFCDAGIILKSDVQTDNKDVIAVQTMSAKKALADAKAYTDDRFEILKARIEALEAR